MYVIDESFFFVYLLVRTINQNTRLKNKLGMYKNWRFILDQWFESSVGNWETAFVVNEQAQSVYI